MFTGSYIDEAGDHQGLCWRMTLGMQSPARVLARGTPTMRRVGLLSRVMVGAGLAPALAFTTIRLSIAFASKVSRPTPGRDKSVPYTAIVSTDGDAVHILMRWATVRVALQTGNRLIPVKHYFTSLIFSR